MRFSPGSALSSLLGLLCLLPVALCASNTTTPAPNAGAIFVFNSSTTTQFVFAMNAVENGDIYFHMAAPVGNAWMAVGFGGQMSGALMFVVYPNSTADGLTISPRVAMYGQSEPTYYPYVTCEQINSTTDPFANTITTTGSEGLGGVMYADAVCHNATKWQVPANGPNPGSLDFTNKQQELIFAVGPSESIQSNDLSAPMNRHAFHAQFTMDMTAATSKTSGTIPGPNGPNGQYILESATAAFNNTNDNNGAQIAHGILMVLTFVIIFPVGSLLLRVFRKVFIHTAFQALGFIFVLIGLGTGITMSSQYNRSRNYNSPHQAIGLLVVSAVIIQFGLGIIAHVHFKKHAAKHPVFSKLHLIIGPLAMFLGLINGGVGINFALNSPYLQYYIIVAIIVALAFIAIRGTVAFCNGQRQKKELERQGAAVASTAGTVYYYNVDQQQYQAVQGYPLETMDAQVQPPQYYQGQPQPHQQQAPPQQYQQPYQQPPAQYMQQPQQQQQQQQTYYPPPPMHNANDSQTHVETIYVTPK